jgi:hypothetical protein
LEKERKKDKKQKRVIKWRKGYKEGKSRKGNSMKRKKYEKI